MSKHMKTSMALGLLICLSGVSPKTAGAQELTKPAEAILAENRIVSATNNYRQRNGLPVLRSNAKLRAAAKAYANILAENNATGHTADGISDQASEAIRLRIVAQGYKACAWAENVFPYPYRGGLAPWQKAAADMMAGWINSSGHEENLRNDRVTDIGVGVVAWQHGDKYYYFAVQVFGDDCADNPEPPVVVKKKLKVLRINNCDDYTNMALQQVEEQAQLGCGFEGPRWTNDRNDHMAWCETASPSVRAAENNERVNGLQWCKDQK